MRTKAEMAEFDRWLGYFERYFTRLDDYCLRDMWWQYGREGEEELSPRDAAAYAAINLEMQVRDIEAP